MARPLPYPLLTLAAAICGAAPFAVRATEPARVPQLAPVTVSATPFERPADDLATPAFILEGSELVRRREATLGDTLAGEPGIHANTFGAGASRPVIRGQDAPRVKVLQDGSEILDASAVSPDHAIVTEPLLTRQVEVLRGPSTLLYGGGAIGGVVNVLDERIPTAVPERGVEAEAEVRYGTAARERAGALGVTAGTGNLAVRIEGVRRRAGDYRAPDWQERRVPGTDNDTTTGTLGASWVTARGYTGIAFTRHNSKYGLPGHDQAHAYEDCHPHGSHLHCGGHDHDHGHDEHAHADGHDDHDDHGHDHDHSHDHDHGAPYADLTSKRWELRSEYRDPLPGFSRVRLRAAHTDYQHSEIEDDTAVSAFRNKGHDARLELQHQPIAGWQGVIGLSTLRSDFTTDGTEAFMPRTVTRNNGIFLLEEYDRGDWRFQAGARHERQRVTPDDAQPRFSGGATSVSGSALWRFAPQYSLGLSLSRSQRLPTAQELYADGIHLATLTYELGNPDLSKETSHNVDLTLRKYQGDTTFEVSAYHNRVKGYIYADTLDQHEDFRLIQYDQRDARFTGVEGRVRQRLNETVSASVFGDYVRARFAEGGNLPRIPSGRLGVALDARWQSWSAGGELYRVFTQNRIADYEDETSGYTMLGAYVSYRGRYAGTAYEVYLRGSNLLDKVAYNHASFLARTTPLMGRSAMLGVRISY